ncbi:MAG: PilZ domain-containing protein [Gammaproteobacteria bacterium]
MQLAIDLDQTISGELEALSREELAACARLLALSVAEHRAKFGIVPLETSTEKLWQGRPKGRPPLPSEAKLALSEAMHLVRRFDTPPMAPKAVAHVGAAHDKRRQLRISVSAPVQIADPAGAWTHAATLRNISWGGASICATEATLAAGDRVHLVLPAARDAKIPILATVLRDGGGERGTEYAVRFESLSPDDEERLQQVLEILLDNPQSTGLRSEARLVQRLEVEYGDAGEFGATIEDISNDGLMLTLLDPLDLDQSLLISLSSADTPLNLTLRARVVHQETLGEGELKMYRVGLKFEHSTEQIRQRTSAVLRHLALLRPRPP